VIRKKCYIETYGCQMNFSDSEIVASILTSEGVDMTRNISEADLIFLNTCSIRENAEQKIFRRLKELRSYKKKKPGLIIGLLGCMGERLKDELLEKVDALDLVAGPDVYRDLPRLIRQAGTGQKAINTILSEEETYAEIDPVRYDSNGVSAFISVMRGCENHCSYCVVPEVRGQERSRDPATITEEARHLFGRGYREVTLLGQNVNSYRWTDPANEINNFAGLIGNIAKIDPRLRIRFATSHPKDLSDDLLETIALHENICRSIHLPVQSGSSRILKKMNRKYSREQYLERISAIRRILPGCAISTDIIAGFCSETEEDHLDTLSLMKEAQFDYAFMFRYSERPGTPAAKNFVDDVPAEDKERRLKEIIELQQELSRQSNSRDKGKIFDVLIEGYSKRSGEHFSGRNSQNKVVVFPKTDNRPGDYVTVRIHGFTSATLLGNAE
jgi:tRNA-2-methylthio-N6-dimethylallyladenosine synthase